MNIYLAIVLGSMIAAWAVNTVVAVLNVKALDPRLPQEFAGVYDAQAYAASQRYTRDVARFDVVAETVGLAVGVAFILCGGFPFVDGLARSVGFGPVGTGVVFAAILLLINDVLNLPFSVHRTFVIEERYGFNRTTARTFVLDRLRGWLLTGVIGGPLLAALLWFFNAAGPLAWVWAWLATVTVMAVMHYLAPSLILPLFNTFTPLEPGPLRDAIEDYARRVGFALSGLYVMDGSRRSARSNAFFTGFGKRRRIALFDTLVAAHSPEEIVAVVAHEVGHYRKGHVLRHLALGVARMGAVFLVMSFFLTSPGLHAAFGMDGVSAYAGLVFFLLLFAPVSMVLSVGQNVISRRHEYEADRFAAQTTGRPEALVSALRCLSVDNLSNLTPHPAHVFLNHSHPPVLARIRALRALGAADATARDADLASAVEHRAG
ncbi:STE24 endopeptidase [Desulfobaculum xiamenense]|uniref:STE24 endopeptidase n=1 Tax=Desulfobaculum xiamenense TaxID=995050 RepID=A0A846QUH9_9BACT|nr:M48 family metallopeptidase [Desulfobaculum xiamenense]NJB69175.1 STE24 endopeptidase [Desulfobaculum xiamenense]